MFFSHELNAVNPKAQSMIAVPDGLDLDSWIGTPFGTSLHDEGEKEGGEDIEVDEYGRPRFPEPEVVDRGGVVLEEGGGRRKKVGGGAKKGKGKKVEQELDPEAERRAAEEKARVGSFSSVGVRSIAFQAHISRPNYSVKRND